MVLNKVDDQGEECSADRNLDANMNLLFISIQFDLVSPVLLTIDKSEASEGGHDK